MSPKAVDTFAKIQLTKSACFDRDFVADLQASRHASRVFLALRSQKMGDVSIEDLADEVGRSTEGRSLRFSLASTLLKMSLIIGSALVTVMHFLMHQWEHAYYVGIACAIYLVVGTIFLAIIDRDASVELEVARKAVRSAQREERRYNGMTADYEQARELFERAQRARNELYISMNIMKEAIEACLRQKRKDSEVVAELLISQASRHLRNACGFESKDHFSISIYKARECKEIIGNRFTELYVVATDRSAPCNKDEARVFPSGVGEVGKAYASDTEHILGDARQDTSSELPPDLRREADNIVHASIVAVPIRLGPKEAPWGVVSLSSGVPKHFDVREKGLQAAEPARAIAGMMGLAVNALAIEGNYGVAQREAKGRR